MMMVANETAVGRYEVVTKTHDFPMDFWAVKIASGRVLIESTEEDSYWVRESSLDHAVERGLVVKVG